MGQHGVEKYIITGLEPFVEYELYVIAKDEVGLEKQSETIRINTGLRLYNNGDECISVTGGWKKIYKAGIRDVKVAKSNTLNLRKENSFLDFYVQGEGITTSIATSACTGGAIGTNSRLQIENYKYMKTKLAVGLSEYNSDAICGMVMDADNLSNLTDNETKEDFGIIAYSSGTDTPKTFTWDISRYKGEYSPGIYLQSKENILSWTNIYEVYLLK